MESLQDYVTRAARYLANNNDFRLTLKTLLERIEYPGGAVKPDDFPFLIAEYIVNGKVDQDLPDFYTTSDFWRFNRQHLRKHYDFLLAQPETKELKIRMKRLKDKDLELIGELSRGRSSLCNKFDLPPDPFAGMIQTLVDHAIKVH